MNNRNDFVINRDAFLYNTSLTGMHSGTRGETFGMKHRDSGTCSGTGLDETLLDGFERGWCCHIAIYSLLESWISKFTIPFVNLSDDFVSVFNVNTRRSAAFATHRQCKLPSSIQSNNFTCILLKKRWWSLLCALLRRTCNVPFSFSSNISSRW